MKLKYYIGLLIFGLFFSTNVFGKNIKPKEIIEKINQNYGDLTSAQIDMTYTIFKGYQSEEILQRSNAVFCISDKNTYRKLETNEFISTSEYSLSIDHQNKFIVLTKPSAASPIDGDVKRMLKFCSDAKVIEQDNKIIVQLILSKDFQVPYSVIRIELNNNYWIEKMTLFYATQMDFSASYFEKKMGYPRLEISYNQLKKRWKDSDGVFSNERFIKLTDTQVLPAERYLQYELIDLRTNQQ
jgi:hypothetical protein